VTEAPLWQRLLSREQWIVAIVFLLAIVLAWASLISMSMPGESAGMTPMDSMSSMASPIAWTPYYASMVFFMWTIMMIAMMLPSAAPMILLYARVAGQASSEPSVLAPTFVFAGTYLALWTLFALAATGAQWALSGFHLLSDATMAVGDRRIGGALLIGAGLYQLTPLKRMCLRNCRSPVSFLTTQWRAGMDGAIRLGLAHGVYCIGCCWLLMTLLFLGGVMNLVWVAAIAMVVLIEKATPAGDRVGQIAGGAAILVGAASIIAPTVV